MSRTFSIVLIEAIFIGIFFAILGTLMSYIMRYSILFIKVPDQCYNYNKFYILQITLFLTGALGHLFFEYSFLGNLNKWFCKRL